MVFKLIRYDNTIVPEKIELSIGTHLIGRGKFLGCDDKRVSRNHGELEVTQHSVSIKSLHENPCFYVRRSTKKSHVLAKDSTIYLSHGDRFGLLPQTYWYELLDIPTYQDTTPSENATATVNHVNDVKRQSDTPSDNSGNDAVINNQNQSLSSSLKVNENNLSSVNENKCVTPTPLILDQNGVAKTIKRSNSTSDNSGPVDVKKVKIEPDDYKDVKSGPSNEPKTVAAGEANNETKDSNKPAEMQPSVRERCFYGGHCYRRNTDHRGRFSHPQDADWGTEERPACHMGQACRRHALRHWRDYTHPDGVRPPVKPTPEPGLTNNPQGKSDQTDKNKEQNNSNKNQGDCQEEGDDCEEDEFEEEEECEEEESDYEEEVEEEMCDEDIDNFFY